MDILLIFNFCTHQHQGKLKIFRDNLSENAIKGLQHYESVAFWYEKKIIS